MTDTMTMAEQNRVLREALRLAWDHIDPSALRISHCKDAAQIEAALALPVVVDKHLQSLESVLTVHEANFVRRVFMRPGCKLNGDDEASHWEDDGSPYGKTVPHWSRPEDLGLITCVGSYKWLPTAKIVIAIDASIKAGEG